MTEIVRVGILGAGGFGHAHGQILAAMPGILVTGVWSRTRAHAEALAATLPAGTTSVYDGWADLIAGGAVDAVIIATAPPVRSAPFAAAVERGLHVLVEKPLTVDLPEAQSMAQLASTATSVTATSFTFRYSPACLAAKQAIVEGQIGRVWEVHAGWYSVLEAATVPAGWAEWFSRREVGGGVLRQMGTHDLDRVRFLSGEEFTRLSGQLTPWFGSPLVWSDRPEATGDAGYAVLAELTGGGQATLLQSGRQHRDHKEMVLAGEHGTLIITETWDETGIASTAMRQTSPSTPPVALDLPREQEGDPLEGLLADFITAFHAPSACGCR